jgi:hypothetical protein
MPVRASLPSLKPGLGVGPRPYSPGRVRKAVAVPGSVLERMGLCHSALQAGSVPVAPQSSKG